MEQVTKTDLIEYIDIEEELEPYMDRFERVTLRATDNGQELLSSSPFREDNSPSFSLNLETGLWIDFGSQDGTWGSGNFFQLIAFFTGDHPLDVIEQYQNIVKGIYEDVSSFTLSVDLEQEEDYTVIDLDNYDYWKYDSNYLNLRGITEKAKESFRVGYDESNKAVAFPIRDIHGNYVNIKFRKTQYKQFYYLPDGQRAGQHLYGGHLVFKYEFEEVFLVESEIDALYLWSYGIPAIALGKAYMSKRQQELIELSPIKTLILSLDNDSAGQTTSAGIEKRLLGKKKLLKHTFPNGVKDVNDLDKRILINKYFNLTEVSPKFLSNI